MKAILMRRPGGPDVLDYVELPTPVPSATQALVRAHSIGVCMPDMLVRTGRYPWMPTLPAVPGIEMSGVVETVGARVTLLKPGDRVLFSAREAAERAGGYAEFAVMEAERLYKLPASTDLEAAAALANYQVAYHLLHSTGAARSAHSVLIYGAAGGVGSAAVQLAKQAGLTVVALVSSAARGRFAHAQGADHVIDRAVEAVPERLRDITGGEGIDLILDPVGGPQFGENFALLARFGTIILYGYLAGWPPADLLPALRAHYATSPALRLFTMHSFDDQPALRAQATHALLQLLEQGAIRPAIHDRIPLAEARRAHEVFESGQVMGKLLLKP